MTRRWSDGLLMRVYEDEHKGNGPHPRRGGVSFCCLCDHCIWGPFGSRGGSVDGRRTFVGAVWRAEAGTSSSEAMDPIEGFKVSLGGHAKQTAQSAVALYHCRLGSLP